MTRTITATMITALSAPALFAFSFGDIKSGVSHVNNAAGQISSAVGGKGGFSLDGITTGVSEIDNALGQVNSAIESMSEYNFGEILNGVKADNELLGCLTQNVDLSDIIGNIPNTDGICGMLNTSMSLTDILDNPIAKCAGVSISVPKDIQNMQSRFQSFCSGSGNSSGGGGGGGGESGNSSGWGSFSGGWSSTTGNAASSSGAGRSFSPKGSVASGIESESVSGGVSTSGSAKPLKDKTYPSGLTVHDLYSGQGGGKLHSKLITDPDSADAVAIKTNNKEALILKDMALKLNGTSNENMVHLPKNQLAVLEDENDVANLISLGEVDYFELENILIKQARAKFELLNANSMSEYYTKEKQAYRDMIANDTATKTMIATLKETAMRAIGSYYDMKLMQIKKRKNYLPNTSYTLERITKIESRDRFKVMALLQMNDETLIKSDMAIKKREVNMKIDQTIKEAYYKASIFRADIAKKEIDAILKAVDTAIH